MSVNTTTNRIAYVGDGVTVGFAYNFKILDAAHLLVYLNGVQQMSGFAVSGVDNDTGGSVTFPTAPAAGVSVVLLREVPLTQPVATVDNITILASVLDRALDRLTMMVQQVFATTSRALRISATDDASVNLELPAKAARANRYLLFDANGAPTAVNSQIDARYYGALASDPATRPDGSARQAGDLYFNSVSQQFRGFSGVAWNNALPSAALTLVNYTETSATAKTTFTIPGGYTIGASFAYLNGVLLFPDEVTMSNGSTAVLTTACSIGDEFRLISYNNFSVADTLSRASNGNDIPDKPTFLTNLGFSSFVQSLRAAADAAAFRLGIGAAQEGNVTTASLAPATLVTAAESINANNNDTTIPTSAAVASHVDGLPRVRALVNFNGVAQTGTYTRTGNTVTVTMTAHGMTTGFAAGVSILTGTASNGTFVVTVVDANTFTYTDPVSGSTSGNIRMNTYMRYWRNLLGILDNGAGDYTVEFFTALPTANYVVGLTAGGGSLTNISSGMAVVAGTAAGPTLKTTTQLRIQVGSSANGIPADNAEINVTVFL